MTLQMLGLGVVTCLVWGLKMAWFRHSIRDGESIS